MPIATRPIARWSALALLLVFSAMGFNSAIGELSSAGTTGQRIATATEFGNAVAGVVATGALWLRHRRARPVLWIWAGLITATGGMAPMVWGGAGPIAGLAAGVASALIAGLVMLLATRRRAA